MRPRGGQKGGGACGPEGCGSERRPRKKRRAAQRGGGKGAASPRKRGAVRSGQAGLAGGWLAGWLTPRRRPSSFFFPCPGHPRTAFLLACPSLSLPDGPCPPAVLRAPSSPPLHSYPAVPAVHPSLACSSSFQVRSVRRAALPPYAPTLAHPRPLPSLSSLPSRSHFSTPPTLARSLTCLLSRTPAPFPSSALSFFSFLFACRSFCTRSSPPAAALVFSCPARNSAVLSPRRGSAAGATRKSKSPSGPSSSSTTASAHTTALDDRSAVTPSFNAVGWLTDARWRSFLASSCG